MLDFIKKYFAGKTLVIAIHELPPGVSSDSAYEFKDGVLQPYSGL